MLQYSLSSEHSHNMFLNSLGTPHTKYTRQDSARTHLLPCSYFKVLLLLNQHSNLRLWASCKNGSCELTCLICSNHQFSMYKLQTKVQACRMSHHNGLNLKEFKYVAKKNAKSIFYLLYECDFRSRLSNLLRCSLKILKVFMAIFWNEKKKKKFSSLENSQAAASGSLCKWTPFVITPNSVTSPSVLWKILWCSLDCWLQSSTILCFGSRTPYQTIPYFHLSVMTQRWQL